MREQLGVAFVFVEKPASNESETAGTAFQGKQQTGHMTEYLVASIMSNRTLSLRLFLFFVYENLYMYELGRFAEFMTLMTLV